MFELSSVLKAIQEFSGKAMLYSYIAQFVLVRVATTQVQDFVGFVEPHEIHLDPMLIPVEVSLNVIPSLGQVVHTTYLGVVTSKLLRVHSILLYMSLMKMLKSTTSNTDP